MADTKQEDLERTLAARELDWHKALREAKTAKEKSDIAFEEYQKAQLELNTYLRVLNTYLRVMDKRNHRGTF
jgi:hypothetical protein